MWWLARATAKKAWEKKALLMSNLTVHSPPMSKVLTYQHFNAFCPYWAVFTCSFLEFALWKIFFPHPWLLFSYCISFNHCWLLVYHDVPELRGGTRRNEKERNHITWSDGAYNDHYPQLSAETDIHDQQLNLACCFAVCSSQVTMKSAHTHNCNVTAAFGVIFRKGPNYAVWLSWVYSLFSKIYAKILDYGVLN